VLQVNLRRAQMLRFFARRGPAVVALDACGGSHHWARKLKAPGRDVRLIPPQYVKPYVKRGKNDCNDAEAICEAAGRPGTRFVLVQDRGPAGAGAGAESTPDAGRSAHATGQHDASALAAGFAAAQAAGEMASGPDPALLAVAVMVFIMGQMHLSTLAPQLVGDAAWRAFVEERVAALLGLRRRD
jgi:hypothetical protein